MTFNNSEAYTSYMVVFPTVKDEGGANSMQIAEIQLDTVPEPAASSLLLFSLAGFLLRRKR